ncbi:hypothetical protein VM1G_05751 [Cytospora mali]|uniref:Uncharacterized protein n=1 Tax=Cytospora mali TaxID=578113 RepID=A0A194W2A5_CYTMA|nr:hypothetical protein VM1G_05751 [Valsa mali]
MAISIITCRVCSDDVNKRLTRMGLPHSKRTLPGGKTRFDLNIASKPSKWDGGNTSLAAQCWRNMSFSYHAATTNGNTLRCRGA